MSRDLDAVVHAHFWCRQDVPIEERLETARSNLGVEESSCELCGEEEHPFCFIPRYSADIGSSWWLIEELRLRGFDVYITMFGHDHKPGRSLVYVMTVKQTDAYGSTETEYASEHSAAHAICLAALAAIGEPYEAGVAERQTHGT